MDPKSRSLMDVVAEYAASETLNLPIFPGVARELCAKLADENSTIKDIAATLAKDQTLAGLFHDIGKLLLLVSSKTGISIKPDPTISPATLPKVVAMSIKEIVLAKLEVMIEDSIDPDA